MEECCLLAHSLSSFSQVQAGLASSYGPGPLAQGMTPPTVGWALLHQLAMGTTPTHLILAIPSLKLSSQITPGCVRSAVKGNRPMGSKLQSLRFQNKPSTR